MIKKLCFFLFLLTFFYLNSYGQNIKIYGTITDTLGRKQSYVTVKLLNTNKGTVSDANGYYEISAPKSDEIKLMYSFIGYISQYKTLKPQEMEISRNVNIVLHEDIKEFKSVDIVENKLDDVSMISIKKINIDVLPTASGNSIEALLKTEMGVSSGNELSSQYNVRGGNYDENLVYVNDIEIYRPLLIRSGQQEGLSFLNSDLVSGINFSAGGFEAKYGDKMSSVLDITYKKPKQFAGSVSGSLLGGTAHVEGVGLNKKLTYVSGVRYKQSKYMLNSLEVEGDYDPRFLDFQTYLTYQPSNKIELGFLVNIAQNDFIFTPTKNEATFGTFQKPLLLTIYFDGMEKDKFNTYFGAFSFTYKPNTNLSLKFIASTYLTQEEETFDIQGDYFLNELNNNLGSENLGDSSVSLGYGEYIEHARNYLTATVANFSHNGLYSTETNKFLWGVKYQQEIINDKISEWDFIDSAGYSINSQRYYPDDVIFLNYSVSAKNSMNSNRLSAYIQDIYTIETPNYDFKINAGLRATYWDYNNEYNISPRFSVQLKPYWNKQFEFRFSTGVYYQPPFYREIRNYDGFIIENPKSQRSIHFVLGGYYDFTAWGRPFVLTSEIYYKKLDNLIPYEIDNVRVRYYADQISKGYTAGLDFKVSGEFVDGVDSWLSVSVMKSEEDIFGDNYWAYYDKDTNRIATNYGAVDSVHVFPGYLPRPSDQRLSVGLFFQDYIPGNENFKVHLGFIFGTPVPVGPPNTARYNALMRSHPAYLRVDLGFSVLLKSEEKIYTLKNPLNVFKSIWLSAEVFNLLGVRNTASYSWITVVPNSSNIQTLEYSQYAVPNKLSGTIVNLRLICKF